METRLECIDCAEMVDKLMHVWRQSGEGWKLVDMEEVSV